MKKIRIAKAMVLAVFLPLFFIGNLGLSFRAQASGYPCYGPNVSFCGASSQQELVNMMNGSDQAGQTYIKAIFDRIGIYQQDITSARMVNGFIRKNDGAIIVNGQVVATGAVNGQRGTEGILGTHTPWVGLEWAHPSANFRPSISGLDIWAYMVNGQFQYGIIKACGNPVIVPPLHVMPTNITIKKEVMNLTSDPVWKKEDVADPTNALGYVLTIQNVSNVSVREVVVKDILPAHMDLIPGTGKLRFNDNQELDIPDRAITGGYNMGVLSPGQIVYVRFATRIHDKDDFPGDCVNLTNTGIAKAGNTDQVQDTASTKVCTSKKPITPKDIPETPPTPVVPQTTPTPAPTLPKAGPVEATAGAMGTAGLGYAGYLWRRSRKLLSDSLRKF